MGLFGFPGTEGRINSKTTNGIAMKINLAGYLYF